MRALSLSLSLHKTSRFVQRQDDRRAKHLNLNTKTASLQRGPWQKLLIVMPTQPVNDSGPAASKPGNDLAISTPCPDKLPRQTLISRLALGAVCVLN